MRLGVEAALVDGAIVPGDVEVEGGLVTGYGLAVARGTGLAVPGFIDLQVNGFGGVDFLEADADGYRRAGEALLETGVTAYLPTFITAPEDQLVAALRELPELEGGPTMTATSCSTRSASSESRTETMQPVKAPAPAAARTAPTT